METLKVGAKAPPFTLPATDGSSFSLEEALASGPVALVFFKKSCPVCQYAFPLYQRLFQAYGNQGATLVGVSQNPKKETEAFAKSFGVTFPILLDDTNAYPVSNAYGLTNVPTVFVVEPGGAISTAFSGFSKRDLEAVGKRLGVQPFHADENVPEWKAG